LIVYNEYHDFGFYSALGMAIFALPIYFTTRGLYETGWPPARGCGIRPLPGSRRTGYRSDDGANRANPSAEAVFNFHPPHGSTALPVILASVVLYGASFMSVPAAVTARVRDGVPPGDWAATIAAFATLFAAGQAAGPWIAGAFADHTSTGATVVWTVVLCAAGAAIAVTAHRPPSAARA
jgi:hypothetical protein